MAVIKSGATSDQLTVQAVSKAARVNTFDDRGNSRGQKVSYCVSTVGQLVAAAGTAPFFSMFGSASKTIRIHHILITGTCATAAVYGSVIVTKRTAAGSGGTATTLTPVPKDSGSAASTATLVKAFTAAPTAGTGGGVVASGQTFLPVTGTPALGVGMLEWFFGNMDEEEGIVLRGTGEGIELSFSVTNTNAATVTVMVEFTEE